MDQFKISSWIYFRCFDSPTKITKLNPKRKFMILQYFSHSYLKMCKIYLKRTPYTTFLHCLALTFCDVIGKLLQEWASLTLQGGTTFHLTSNLAGIPVSRVRTLCHLHSAEQLTGIILWVCTCTCLSISPYVCQSVLESHFW